ncbi:hypothetical protein KDA_70020 [Dictyobacter alpinus]|uniref:Tyrosine recombinase XerD n=1 Tax=Dictyobacter alpinus TaxID=2014873 RepID=A0A402BJJ0_9CHLR|nr:tyrosine-type recombinase/integrase [Dictyobacter alpinus]GCE31518.1 hypothetical protein KDA_70020 [Dictyobacter alpinus]
MKLSKRRQGAQSSTPSQQNTESLSFDRALELFLKSQNAAGHSKTTQKDYLQVITWFWRYISDEFGYTNINEVEEADIIEWLDYLRNATSRLGKPYSSRTISTYYTDVTAFFSWLVRHNYICVNPMKGVPSPKTDKALIRVFTEDELVLLNAACDRAASGKAITPDERKALAARDRAFLWLLLSTGIRVSEACGLLFSDIDWDTGMIYVRGKGAKERKVSFGKVARQYLDTYIRYWRGGTTSGDEYVFLNVFGNPLKTAAAGELFRRLKKVAGITDKRVSAHTCRHWFAVNAIKNGVPSTVLQGWLGHEQLEMINTYVRLAEQDNRDLYARFSPVDSLNMHHSSKDRRKQMRDWRNSRKKN